MPLKISVLGAGRVGATLAAAWLKAGEHVNLVDIDAAKIEKIKSKVRVFEDEPHIDDIFADAINKRLFATTDARQAIRDSDVVFITVPVSIKNKDPDFTNLLIAAKDIGHSVKKGMLIVLETSVPPGTTRNLLAKEIDSLSSLKAGSDYHLAYSPERIYEGRALADLEQNYPKIVAGINNESLERASILYSKIAKKGIIKMSSLEAAEAEKLFEGVYRDVNIALANELARFCEVFGLDYWEIMNASNSQPFCHLHKPGSGVGGACIPVYPEFIRFMAERRSNQMLLLSTARMINKDQPIRVAEDAVTLAKLKKGDKIAILGLSFRGDVADDRLSPSYEISSYLAGKGFKVVIHDPICRPSHANGNFIFTDSLDEAIKGSRLAIISTDHSFYKEMKIEKLQQINPDIYIYDARGVFKNLQYNSSRVHVIGVGKI